MQRKIDLIVVHCSATRPNQAGDAAAIDAMHRARKWNGIGYHFVINKHGILEKGRDLEKIGAHAYGYNRHSIGICLEGGLNSVGLAEDTFSNNQKKVLWTLLDTLHSIYPSATILGHRDLSPDIDGDGIIEPFEWLKMCPCFDVRKEYAEYTKRSSG